MHLADAFIQSDLQCIQAIHLFCQYVSSLEHILCVPRVSNIYTYIIYLNIIL